MTETSVYPGALDSFTDKEAKRDKVSKADINLIQNCIEAIETELGLNPAGSVVDLATRLFVCIGNDGALRQGTSFPGSPIEGQLFYRTDLNVVYIYNGSGWDANGVEPYAAGDQLLESADTERSTTSGSYVILKEIAVARSGTLRIKFDLTPNAGTAFGRIYRNGSAVGTEQSETTGGKVYATKSEDISGWSPGDLCQVYAYFGGGGGGSTAFVRNFRLYADTPTTEEVNTD